MKKTIEENKEPRRYDGPLAEVAELAAKSTEQRDALVGFLAEFEQIDEQLKVAEKMAETLPQEIDGLLKCGRLNEETIEKLARKRATLDLVPGRLESLFANYKELEKSDRFSAAKNAVEGTSNDAARLFDSIQMAAAVADYMALGVSEIVASGQVDLRPDINMEHFHEREWAVSVKYSMPRRLRLLLADFDCFAAGLSPVSAGTDQIRAQWIKA